MTGVAFCAQANFAYVSLRLSDAWSAYGRWQLAEFNLTSGRITQTTNERGSAMRPTLSPDGSYVVYGTRIDGITQLETAGARLGRSDDVGAGDGSGRATKLVAPARSAA